MIKKHLLNILMIVISTGALFSQQTLDQSFQFPTGGTFKKYHIYVPSAYNTSTSSKLMVGFHPFNTSRWDGKSWRDSLISFAEYHDLLLVCPDGGSDGSIDDQVDYDFTTALIDSMKQWYNIDPFQVFGVGFSVGGKAVYEYGLKNHQIFKGFITMGAAISDPTFVDDVISNAKCKNYYIIHGDKDDPNTRYYPIKASLENNQARVNAILMAGIGHTFDFPNRLSIMIKAFNYIDTASCNYTGITDYQEEQIELYPNPVQSGNSVLLNWSGHQAVSVSVYSISGEKISSKKYKNSKGVFQLEIGNYPPGSYLLKLQDRGKIMSRKLTIIP